MLSKQASSTIFWVFGMTRPRIEPRSSGPLENCHILHVHRGWVNTKSTCIYINIQSVFIFRKLHTHILVNSVNPIKFFFMVLVLTTVSSGEAPVLKFGRVWSHPITAITPKSTLIQSGSICCGLILGSNRPVNYNEVFICLKWLWIYIFARYISGDCSC